ncbi:MAG TPA: nucleoside 2-deoxyribosyltransferase [Verrucomicrobiae bacterium]|nr:nucleoside 2-deoxyribosyltransferase [Verrucomicrobiae bacterium]
MKIYFGFTVAGDRSGVEMARRIVGWLEARGHEVLTRHLVRDDARERDRMLTPRAVYERDMQWLAGCDIFIAEVSGSSFGMGFEAGLVLGSSQKRAILLHRADAAERISLLITGNQHPRCTVVAYSAFDEIERVLEGIS